MASPTRRFPDPCQDQKSASVRLATRVETYFLTSSAFTTNNTPPTHGPTNRKNVHTKTVAFFFIPAPKGRPGQPRTLLGCNHAHQVALAAPQELPVPYQVQWIRPACLPNLGFWEGKEVEKSWNEIKWTPVVWHSWLENHPSPFLPTPIRNKTSSRFKKMRNSLDLMAWNYHGLKVDQNPSWENMRDPGPLVVVSHEMDSNLRRFVTARFGALFDFI